jgi:hypothetical protein
MSRYVLALLLGLAVLWAGAAANNVVIANNTQEASMNSGSSVIQSASNTITASGDSNVAASNIQQANGNSGSS